MDIALNCLWMAVILPYLFTVIAKVGAKGFDNRTPRVFLSKLEGWRARANYAQMNSFESLACFAPAVLIALHLQANIKYVNFLCITYVCARIAYGLCYIFDRSTLRSIAWFIGFMCIMGLFSINTPDGIFHSLLSGL